MMNDAEPADAQASSKPGFWPLVAVAGFILGIHGAWWLFGDTVFQHGNLADTDSYARLLRVLRLLETGAWFDNSLPRANWPDGGALHWTRPFDVLMIAIALPMMPVLGTAKAVFWSGVFISPLLHVLVALVMAWAAAPLIGRTGGLLAGALTALQFGVLGYAMVGNADHHLFLGLIAIVAFGFTVRALRDAEGASGRALAAGSVLAFGYWAGMESQILAVLCIGMVGLRWVVENDDTATASHRLAVGLTGGLFLALLADRGPGGFFEVGYDRISIVHLTLGGLILLFWTGVRAAKSVRRWPVRLALAALGGSVTLSVMGGLYPKVFGNPLMDADPELQAIYYKVSEYSSLGDVSHVLLYLGAGVIGVPWLAWRLKTIGRGKSVWMWGLLAVLTLVYGDSYLNIDVKALWAASDEGRAPVMSVLKNDGRWDASNASFKDAMVTRFEKGLDDPAAEGLDYIDYGMSVLNREVIKAHIPSGQAFDLAELSGRLAEARVLRGFEASERFYEIGSPEGLADLEKYLGGLTPTL